MCKPIPCETQFAFLPTRLKQCTLKDCIKKFSKVVSIGSDELKLAGTPQGNKVPVFLVLHKDKKQLGQISLRNIQDPFCAWKQLTSIVGEMKAGTLEVSRVAFYARREELHAMLG